MTIYYVKNGGSDAADGLSDGNAWETVGKVNTFQASLNPGDAVLFRAGDTFTDAYLYLTEPGTSGNLIAYGAYGTGARPIISQNNEVALYTDATAVAYVYLVGLEFVSTGTGYAGAQIHLSFSIIEDCVFSGGVNAACLMDENTTDCHVIGCTFHDGGTNGLQIISLVTPADGMLVEDCVCYGNGSDQAADHGIYLREATNSTLRNNHCYGNAAGGIKVNSGTNNRVSRNRLHDNAKGLIMDCEAAKTSSGHTVDYNIIYDNIYHGVQFLNSGNGNLAETFYNNLIFNNAANDDHGQVGFQEAGATTTWRNNIFWYDTGLGSTGYLLVFYDSDELAAQDFDYNYYWIEGSSPGANLAYDGTARTLSYWQGTAGMDANGNEADPLFLAQYTNLRLRSDSPCIETGTPIAGLLVDLDGHPLGRGTNPDIGCYETLKGGPRGI